MAQVFKDVTVIEMKCSAAKFFEVFTTKAHLLPKICPDKIQNCDLIEGDGETVGSVKFWKIVPISGKTETVKEKIEAIDLINKKVTFLVIEGDCLNYYKDFKFTVEVTSESGKTMVKGSLEYEKLNEAFPAPSKHLDFFVTSARDIDSYLSKP